MHEASFSKIGGQTDKHKKNPKEQNIYIKERNYGKKTIMCTKE